MAKGIFNISEDTVMLVQVVCGLFIAAGFLARDVNFLFAGFAISLLGALRVLFETGVSQKEVLKPFPALSLSGVFLMAYAMFFDFKYLIHAILASAVAFVLLLLVFAMHSSKGRAEQLMEKLKQSQVELGPGDEDKK